MKGIEMRKMIIAGALMMGAITCDKPAESESLIGKIASDIAPKMTITVPPVSGLSFDDSSPEDYILDNEIVVSEQYFNEGNMDLKPPMILSYWMDIAGYDDGTLKSAIIRCEDRGGEPIGWFDNYLKGWVYKCEQVDY